MGRQSVRRPLEKAWDPGNEWNSCTRKVEECCRPSPLLASRASRLGHQSKEQRDGSRPPQLVSHPPPTLRRPPSPVAPTHLSSSTSQHRYPLPHWATCT